MDESPFVSGSQDIYARQSHAARDVSNLMDESLGGASLADEDDFSSQQGSSTRTVRETASSKGKERASGAYTDEDIAGRAAALDLDDGDGIKDRDNQSELPAQSEHDNELPTEPPLSESERKERVLIEERDGLAKMNTMLERTLQSFESALPRVQRMEQTIATTHDLLNTYVKLLSQTVHTQQLLLDPDWEAQKDLDDIAAEEAAAIKAQQEEEERLEREVREAEERAQREREEAERKAMMANATMRGRGVSRGARGTRGVPNARGSARGTTARGRATASTRGLSRT